VFSERQNLIRKTVIIFPLSHGHYCIVSDAQTRLKSIESESFQIIDHIHHQLICGRNKGKSHLTFSTVKIPDYCEVPGTMLGALSESGTN